MRSFDMCGVVRFQNQRTSLHLETQSFDRLAPSKKPRVRSIAVSDDAIAMEM